MELGWEIGWKPDIKNDTSDETAAADGDRIPVVVFRRGDERDRQRCREQRYNELGSHLVVSLGFIVIAPRVRVCRLCEHISALAITKITRTPNEIWQTNYHLHHS